MTHTAVRHEQKPPLRGRAYRASNAMFAAIFLFAAAVQYNDPDPLSWIAIYLAAATACVLAFLQSNVRYYAAAVGFISVIWALTIATRLFGISIPLEQVFGTMEMANVSVEETRETIGLLIVAGWMLILTLTSTK